LGVTALIKTWVVFIVSKDCPREGDDMASKILSWFLVLALGFILCTPAQADSGTIGGVGTGKSLALLSAWLRRWQLSRS
jgi:hypothetical protein